MTEIMKIVAIDLVIKALEREEGCHDEAEEGDVFRCSACHYQEPSLGGWNYCPNCGRKVEK